MPLDHKRREARESEAREGEAREGEAREGEAREGEAPAEPSSHEAHTLARHRKPTIVFLTVCTKNREPWLATADHHELLRSIWLESTAWLVGRYVILPDHLHLFAAPGTPELSLERWVTYWKSCFTKRNKKPQCRWQPDHWDTRLRASESYDEKWEYVASNPVRHGLALQKADWPYQGVIYELAWK